MKTQKPNVCILTALEVHDFDRFYDAHFNTHLAQYSQPHQFCFCKVNNTLMLPGLQVSENSLWKKQQLFMARLCLERQSYISGWMMKMESKATQNLELVLILCVLTKIKKTPQY